IIKKIERARVKMEQIKPGSTLPRGKKEGGLTVKLFKGHYTSLAVATVAFSRTESTSTLSCFMDPGISISVRDC
ncbi:MAG: hypothetical protein ACREYE_26900, partial [Gammaproteobacteria bacterium]